MMDMLRLHRASDREMDAIHSLYVRAFPLAERKPFSIICRMREAGTCDVYAIWQGDSFAGLATVICMEGTALLDYFAIEEAFRGCGLGGRALDRLRDIYRDRPLFIEIETVDPGAENYAQRLARKQFYLHHGFVESGERVRLFGVDMEILSVGSPIAWKSCRAVYRKIYRPFFYLKVRRLPKQGRTFLTKDSCQRERRKV